MNRCHGHRANWMALGLGTLLQNFGYDLEGRCDAGETR